MGMMPLFCVPHCALLTVARGYPRNEISEDSVGTPAQKFVPGMLRI